MRIKKLTKPFMGLPDSLKLAVFNALLFSIASTAYISDLPFQAELSILMVVTICTLLAFLTFIHAVFELGKREKWLQPFLAICISIVLVLLSFNSRIIEF